LCGNCSESYYSTRKFFWESLVPNSKGGDYGSVCIDMKDAVSFFGNFFFFYQNGLTSSSLHFLTEKLQQRIRDKKTNILNAGLRERNI
jgi:hypothetical protein